jgi:hypothetical protein
VSAEEREGGTRTSPAPLNACTLLLLLLLLLLGTVWSV